MTKAFSVGLCTLVTLTTGCGTFTGIPSHGGGKRFAIEQELIAASARAVAQSIDVRPLVGKRCALFVIAMGDEGGGNLSGGRYAWEAAIRGEYVNAPTVRTRNKFPILPTTTTTEAGGVTSTTRADNALNYPSRTKTKTEGPNIGAGGGFSYNWPPSYHAEAFVNPRDSEFLSAVLHEAMVLRGVQVVSPEQAEVDVYVTVDVFGTVRSRTDLHVYNRESLLAKTALQMTAFDRNRQVVLSPTTASYEAEYREHYILWMGPVSRSKDVRPSSQLLVDFSHLASSSAAYGTSGLGPMPAPAHLTTDKTRVNRLTRPRPTPEPFRPEDVKRSRSSNGYLRLKR